MIGRGEARVNIGQAFLRRSNECSNDNNERTKSD